jgi:hypothetical protein
MNQKKLNPSEGDLIASAKDALRWRQLHEQDSPAIEDGFYSSKQIGKFIGMKPTATREFIHKKISQGKCVTKDFLVTINNKKRLTPHYKITDENL